MLNKRVGFSKTREYFPTTSDQKEVVWEMDTEDPFNELIVSWNGFRPKQGRWLFYVSLRNLYRWSPWLEYAEWATDSQKTFQSSPPDSEARTYQDCAVPKTGFCYGYRVKVISEGGSNLANLDSIYACTSNLANLHIDLSSSFLAPSIYLPNVPLQSQMVLDHPRRKDMCSPTSITTAIRYLSKKIVDPIFFANRSHDDGFDIYGNWILNTAAAYDELSGAYRIHVERLESFSALYSHLLEANPVIVSVKGEIPGAAKPYQSGHLVCVIGYDSEKSQVICIDPAFADNPSTLKAYPLTPFLKAWSLRQNIAYIFRKKSANFASNAVRNSLYLL
jgi:hypothetical protein